MVTPDDEQMNPAAALQCLLDGKRVALIDWPSDRWLERDGEFIRVEGVDDKLRDFWRPLPWHLTTSRYRLVC